MSSLASRLAEIDRRFLVAVALLVLVALTAGTVGGVYAYQQGLPVTPSLNLQNGQQEVPLEQPLVLTFRRPLSEAALAAHLKIAPVADGHLVASRDQRTFTYTTSAPYSDHTTYTVSVSPYQDVHTGARVAAGRWSFRTTLVPRVTSVTTDAGAGIADDAELATGTTLRITFNSPMDAPTVKLLVNGGPATLAWAADGLSATLDTKPLRAGPLALSLAGGRDAAGHALDTTWKLLANLVFRVNVHTTPLRYPALIQIPNDPSARDQSGIQSADMVFEYATEGGIPRLTAIFTRAPDKIGPVRSGRLISIKLTQHYRGELFLSGTSEGTFQVLRNSGIPALFDTVGYYYRSSDRPPPNNLYTSAEAVARSENSGGPAPSQLPTGHPTLPANADGQQVTVAQNGHRYSYDPSTGTYTKSEDGHTFADASIGQPLHIGMLVVMHTRVTTTGIVEDSNGAHGLDYDLDSGGPAEFYLGGARATGHWSAPDRTSPLLFALDGGQPVALPAGLVWIDVVP